MLAPHRCLSLVDLLLTVVPFDETLSFWIYRRLVCNRALHVQGISPYFLSEKHKTLINDRLLDDGLRATVCQILANWVANGEEPVDWCIVVLILLIISFKAKFSTAHGCLKKQANNRSLTEQINSSTKPVALHASISYSSWRRNGR